MSEVRASVRYGYSINLPAKFSAWLRSIENGEARRNIFSVAASRVSELVRRHLSSASASRHATADRLSANRTGFLEEGARSGVTPHATADEAEVLIRVPGISRAFRDLTVTPRNWDYLTIPSDALSYGRRAVEVRALGWAIFRPPAKGAKLVSKNPRRFSDYKNILMGAQNGEVKKLYSLAKSANLRQDRGLLPSDKQISSTAKLSIKKYLQRRFSA